MSITKSKRPGDLSRTLCLLFNKLEVVTRREPRREYLQYSFGESVPGGKRNLS